MQLVLLGGAGGLVAGFVLGYLIAKSGVKKVAEEYEGRLKKAQERLDSATKEAASHLDKERAKVLEAEKRATGVEAQKTALEKSLEQQKSQSKQLQTALAEADAVKAKLSTEIEAHANARQQAEGRAKQSELAFSQAQQALANAQSQLQGTQTKLAELKESSDRRDRELQKLRSELAAVKHDDASLEESAKPFADTDGSLDGILKLLMEREGQRAAVLADTNGVIVAAVGEAGLKEGMAATAHMVGSMCTQLVGMVPFSAMRSFALQDSQSNVIAGRAFACQGETVGLVTYGTRTPSDRMLDGAMSSLSVALE